MMISLSNDNVKNISFALIERIPYHTGLTPKEILGMEKTRITIFDTTLRDGEHSPGCSMNVQEKLRLARQLDRLGVDVIEAGWDDSRCWLIGAKRLHGINRRRATRREVRSNHGGDKQDHGDRYDHGEIHCGDSVQSSTHGPAYKN
jgi:hypothetical protein